MANVEVTTLKIETTDAQKSMGNLKQQLKETKEQMIELRMRGEETSEAYQQLSAKAGELSKAMQLANNDIKEASTTFTNTVSYVSGSLAGVAGAVQAATGALSLMGVEMGEDSKLMKALVSAMAVTSGLTAIQSSVEAFKKLTTNIKRSTLAQKGLNAAMKANPVGAIITGVVALTAAVTAFATAVSKARDEQYALQAAAEDSKLLEHYQELEKQMDRDVKMMELDGATSWETFQKRKENQRKLVQEAESNLNKYNELLMNGNRRERKRAKEQLEIWTKAFDERTQAYQAMIDDTSLEWKKDEKRREKEQEDARKKAAEKAKAAREKAAQELKADLDNIAKYNRTAEIGLMGDKEGELAKLKDAFEEQKKLYEKRGKDITTLTEYYRKQEEEINKKYDDKAKEKAKSDAEKGVEKRKLELESEYYRKRLEIIQSGEKDISKALSDLEFVQLDNEKMLLKQQFDNQLITQEEFQNALLELETEYAEKRREVMQTEAEKKKEIQQAYINSMLDISGSLGGIMGSMTEFLQEDTEAFKNLKAAQAIINTIAGAVAAFMGITESTGGWGIAAAIAQAAAVTAAGMAEVKKIYAVDTSGGKNATATASTSAVSSLSQNYNNTRLVNNGGGVYDLTRLEPRNTRVYVLTQDIEDGLDRVSVQTQRNTF